MTQGRPKKTMNLMKFLYPEILQSSDSLPEQLIWAPEYKPTSDTKREQVEVRGSERTGYLGPGVEYEWITTYEYPHETMQLAKALDSYAELFFKSSGRYHKKDSFVSCVEKGKDIQPLFSALVRDVKRIDENKETRFEDALYKVVLRFSKEG
jgi:hypothetical protein